MALPNLGALGLGPPTGPIFRWEQPRKRTRWQTAETRRCEGPQLCPISQEDLVDGQDVYSFPGSDGKTAYEIPKLYEYFLHQIRLGRPLKDPTNSNKEAPPEDWAAIQEWMERHHHFEADDDADEDMDADPGSPWSPASPHSPGTLSRSDAMLRLRGDRGIDIERLVQAGDGNSGFLPSLVRDATRQLEMRRARRAEPRFSSPGWSARPFSFFDPTNGVPVEFVWNEQAATFEMTAKFYAHSAMGLRLREMEGADGELRFGEVRPYGNNLSVQQLYLAMLLSRIVGGGSHFTPTIAARISPADYTFTVSRMTVNVIGRGPETLYYYFNVTISTAFMAKIHRMYLSGGTSNFYPSDDVPAEFYTFPRPIDPIWTWPTVRRSTPFPRPIDPIWSTPGDPTEGPTGHWEGFRWAAHMMIFTLYGVVSRVVVGTDTRFVVPGWEPRGDTATIITLLMDDAVEHIEGRIEAEAPFYYAVVG